MTVEALGAGIETGDSVVIWFDKNETTNQEFVKKSFVLDRKYEGRVAIFLGYCDEKASSISKSCSSRTLRTNLDWCKVQLCLFHKDFSLDSCPDDHEVLLLPLSFIRKREDVKFVTKPFGKFNGGEIAVLRDLVQYAAYNGEEVQIESCEFLKSEQTYRYGVKLLNGREMRVRHSNLCIAPSTTSGLLVRNNNNNNNKLSVFPVSNNNNEVENVDPRHLAHVLKGEEDPTISSPSSPLKIGVNQNKSKLSSSHFRALFSVVGRIPFGSSFRSASP